MNLRYPPDSEAVLDDADHDQLALRQRIGQQAERGVFTWSKYERQNPRAGSYWQ
jgi:hypothetical protein